MFKFAFILGFVALLLAAACGQTASTPELIDKFIRTDLRYEDSDFTPVMGPVRADILNLDELEVTGLSVVDHTVEENAMGNPIYSINGVPLEEGFLVRFPGTGASISIPNSAYPTCQPGSRAYVYTAVGALSPPSRPTPTSSGPDSGTPTRTPTPPPKPLIDPIPTRLAEEGLLAAGWPNLPLEYIQPDYRGKSYRLSRGGYINDFGWNTSIPTVSLEEVEVVSITYRLDIDLQPPLESLIRTDTVTDKIRILRFFARPADEVIVVDECPPDLVGEQFVYYENFTTPDNDATLAAQSRSDECGEISDNNYADGRWAYHFKTLQEMDQGVNAVVLAKILGCSPGKVHQGNRLTYFTDVHVQIIEDWTRKPIGLTELTISMPGGKTTPFIRWNPPFDVGEEYLLFLRRVEEEGPETYFVPSPMSRYRISEGKLEANLAAAPIEEMDGRTVKSVEEEIQSIRFSLDSFADVQPPSGWDTVVINPYGLAAVPSFSLELPPGWEVHEFGWDFEGLHYSGELVGDDIRLTFIYGFFGGREAESYSIDRFLRHSEDISGEEATLIRPKGSEAGPAVAFFREFQGRRRRLRLTSNDLTEEQQRTAFAILRSVRGLAGLLKLSVNFYQSGPIVEPGAPIPNVVVEVVNRGGKTQVGERRLDADYLPDGGWDLNQTGKYEFWLNPGTYDIDIHFLENALIFKMPRRFVIGTDDIVEEEMKVYLAQDSPEG